MEMIEISTKVDSYFRAFEIHIKFLKRNSTYFFLLGEWKPVLLHLIPKGCNLTPRIVQKRLRKCYLDSSHVSMIHNGILKPVLCVLCFYDSMTYKRNDLTYTSYFYQIAFLIAAIFIDVDKKCFYLKFRELLRHQSPTKNFSPYQIIAFHKSFLRDYIFRI